MYLRIVTGLPYVFKRFLAIYGVCVCVCGVCVCVLGKQVMLVLACVMFSVSAVASVCVKYTTWK